MYAIAMRLCDLCSEEIAGRRWVLLNRYLVGSGSCRRGSEGVDEEGECIWEVGSDEEGMETYLDVTGPVLCFPGCLLLWIEGAMTDVDIRLGK